MTEETVDPPVADKAFEVELAKLAAHVVQKATQENTPFDESVDAFKALTAYYALRLKHRQGDEESDDGGFSFDTAQLGGEEKPNGDGAPAVRSRPRRATS